MTDVDRKLKRGMIVLGALIALLGGIPRLILAVGGEPFMEGRLYALFISGLVVLLVGWGYDLVFSSDEENEEEKD